MPAYAIIGGQWGDEGKGKVVDYCTSDVRVLNADIKGKHAVPADIAVRYGGADLRLTDVNDDDLIRLDIYTRTAFEFLAEYNACAHR